jgi:two-component system response regulator YesN
MYQKTAEACSQSIAYTKSHMIELIIYIFNHMPPKDTACLNSNELVTDLLSIDNFRELDIYMRSKIVALCKSSSIQEEGSKNKLVAETKKYIEDHYNEDISLEELAKEICVSPNYLSRLFRDKTGENYIEYLTNIRINKAKELMMSTEMSVKEISYNIGYNDPNYFSRLFKKIEKVSPSEYVKYALSTQGVKS